MEPLYSTRRIIDACFPGLVVTGRELPEGIHEAVSRTREGGVLVYNRALPTAAKRFAIAHGLAHLLFDDGTSACRAGFLGDPDVEARADGLDPRPVDLGPQCPRLADRYAGQLDQRDERGDRSELRSATPGERPRRDAKDRRRDGEGEQRRGDHRITPATA